MHAQLQPSHQASTSEATHLCNHARAAPLIPRRQALLYLSLSYVAQRALPTDAAERRGIGRYIKKKALDPLITYVPAVLQAQKQLLSAGQLMGEDPVEARVALRSGAFEGLRDNVRALGEYAASNKSATEQEAKELVAHAFGRLQDFDFELFQAIRNKEKVSDAAGAKLQSAAHALDRLLATVPASELDQAKNILEAIEKGGRPGQIPSQKAVDFERLQRLFPAS
ncbi:g1343 [Coccomyxa elongata]